VKGIESYTLSHPAWFAEKHYHTWPTRGGIGGGDTPQSWQIERAVVQFQNKLANSEIQFFSKVTAILSLVGQKAF